LSEQKQKSPKATGEVAILDGLKEEILKALGDLQNQPVPTEKDIETVLRVTAYKGAWPPASVIAEQEAAYPGAGVRLLEWTERQTAHRHNLERLQVEGQERRMDRGQLFSLIIPICALVCAAYIASVAHGVYGTIIAVSALVVGVGGPAGLHLAKGIGQWLGEKKRKR
jgi:uncharacterized membrane protein